MSFARGGRASRRATGTGGGFTLVEMLVSTAILLGIMAILLSMIQQTSSLWKNTSEKLEGFRNARNVFDAMTRTISQATLNTYLDYQDANHNWVGTSGQPAAFYARRSDLHFICGQGSTLLGSSSTLTPVTHAIFSRRRWRGAGTTRPSSIC